MSSAPQAIPRARIVIAELYTVRSDESPDWADELDLMRDALIDQGVELLEVYRQMSVRLAELRLESLKEYRAGLNESAKHMRVPVGMNGFHRNDEKPVRDSTIFDAINKRIEELDLATLILEDDEPIEWIWGEGDQGYLEVGSVCCLHGFGGTGKSMVVQALGRSVNAGTSFLGQPCKKGRVLIVDAENPKREIKRRTKRLGLDPTKTRYLRAASPILSVGFAQWLENEIIDSDADLVILDSQRGLWSGDEKEAAEIRLFYTELRAVAEAAVCAILVIHHDNKGLTFSGSTDIDASVDVRLHMTRDAKDKTIRYLDQAKMRGAEELTPIEVVIRFEGARLYVEKGERTPSGPARDQRKATAEEISMWVRQQANQQAKPTDIRNKFKISDTTLRGRREELETHGIAYQESGSLSVYYATPQTPTLPQSLPQS